MHVHDGTSHSVTANPAATFGSRRVGVGAVVVVLLAAAFFAVVKPNMDEAWRRRREHCAYVRVKEIAAAQSQLAYDRTAAADGALAKGYGFLSDLAGPTAQQSRTDAGYTCPCARWGLHEAFTQVGVGRYRAAGYVFEVFLEAADGGWASEAEVVAGRQLDPAKQQLDFVCYAWPQSVGEHGSLVFVIDARGDVQATKNRQGRYVGDRAPVPGVTGFGGDSPHSRLACNVEDAFGDRWAPW